MTTAVGDGIAAILVTKQLSRKKILDWGPWASSYSTGSSPLMRSETPPVYDTIGGPSFRGSALQNDGELTQLATITFMRL